MTTVANRRSSTYGDETAIMQKVIKIRTDKPWFNNQSWVVDVYKRAKHYKVPPHDYKRGMAETAVANASKFIIMSRFACLSASSASTTGEGSEGVYWDHSMFNLPIKDLNHRCLDAEKNKYFTQTIQSLNGATAPSLTKPPVLTMKASLQKSAGLFNAKYRFDVSIRAREVGTFRFADVKLRKVVGTSITMRTGTRQSGLGSIPHLHVEHSSGLGALRTAVVAGVTTLHPMLDATELCSPAVSLVIFKTVNSTQPMLGYAVRAIG
eukprot:scaffold70982_cov62-Attheya_sp.AAC.3